MGIAPHRAGVLICLITMIFGPWVSHPAYDLVRHTTSELAGQNMPNAWIMRFGLFAYGGTVAWTAARSIRQFPFTGGALVLFGLGLIGTALVPHVPIDLSLGFDPVLDWWHAVFATLVGVAFTIVCISDILGNLPLFRPLSWLGMVASVLIPLAMINWPEYAGAAQRLMFVVSFVWVWHRLPPGAEEAA